MAYSDYGGYAYRNREHLIQRSDFTLTPDGGFGVPGMYPGFAAIACGKSKEEVEKLRDYPNGHAVLGDGPIFVCLYKQSTLRLYRGFEEVDTGDIVTTPGAKVEEHDWLGRKRRWVDDDPFKASEEPCVLEIDGHKITVYWRVEDNHYQYVQLEQPDGTVWHGWSGYGVGAGLEDCGYGYSTDDREAELWTLFPRPTQG